MDPILGSFTMLGSFLSIDFLIDSLLLWNMAGFCSLCLWLGSSLVWRMDTCLFYYEALPRFKLNNLGETPTSLLASLCCCCTSFFSLSATSSPSQSLSSLVTGVFIISWRLSLLFILMAWALMFSTDHYDDSWLLCAVTVAGFQLIWFGDKFLLAGCCILNPRFYIARLFNLKFELWWPLFWPFWTGILPFRVYATLNWALVPQFLSFGMKNGF